MAVLPLYFDTNIGHAVGGKRPIEMATQSELRWSYGGLPLRGITKEANAMVS